MSLDLFLLLLVGFAAIVGAISGAARQVAQWIALGTAYFFARPLGLVLAPSLLKTVNGSMLIAQMAATLLVFIVAFLMVRFVATRILRRILAGKAQERASTDRFLGFLLGGTKIAAIAYVLLSGLVYAESHVEVAGKRLGFLPHDSLAFSFVRTHNLFELTQFRAVKDLQRVGKAMNTPVEAQRMRANSDYQALLKDPRFRQILDTPVLRHALQMQDPLTLLRNNNVLQLIQDATAAGRLNAAADAATEK